MTEPTFGIEFLINDSGPLLPVYGDFSVVGLVLPSNDANNTVFPLNTPVDVNSGDPATLAAAGTGDLYMALLAINAQLVNLQGSARCVVVRVPQGGNTAETTANIIGNANASTGIYALLTAPALLGVTPRLIGAPGYTGEFTFSGGTTGVTRVAYSGNVGGGAMTLASPAYITGWQPGVYEVVCVGGTTSANAAAKAGGNLGTGTLGTLSSGATTTNGVWRVVCYAPATGGGAFEVYTPAGVIEGIATVGTPYVGAGGLQFTISAGSSDFVVNDEFDVAVSEAVPHTGGVFSVTDPFGNQLSQATVGQAYANQIAFTIAYSTPDYQIGDSFAVTVAVTGGQLLANPLCAALPPVLEALMACAIVGGPGTNLTDSLNWQMTLNSKRLIPVDDPVIIENLAGTGIQYQDVAAQALGIAVAVDFAHVGFPFWSFANQPIQGIIGTKRVDSFSLLDGATTGQEYLAGGIGIVARGNHADTSLTDSGWALICFNNASSDPYWTLLNKVRGRDFLHLALLKAIRTFLGDYNITPHSVQAVLNQMGAVCSSLVQMDCSIGYAVGFDSSVNSPEMLRAGSFRVYVNNEEPSPVLVVTVDSGLDFNALVSEVATLGSIMPQTGQIGLQ